MWDSPVLTPAMVNGLLLDTDLEFIPATGTRITTNKKADQNTSGDYIIPGYGRFGRIDLTDRAVALIRSRLGSCLGLDIRGERFVGLYNIADIKALYIRENVVWSEPVVKQPMTELEDRTVVEPETTEVENDKPKPGNNRVVNLFSSTIRSNTTPSTDTSMSAVSSRKR